MKQCRRVLTLVAAVMLITPSLTSAQSLYAAVRGGLGLTPVTASSPTVDGQRINYSGMTNHSLELSFAVKF